MLFQRKKLRRYIISIAIFLNLFLISIYFSSNSLSTTSTNSNAKGAKSPVAFGKNIFFLNVHNSASSNIQNILVRYGNTYHLNFALPYTDTYLGHPQPFYPNMALPLSQGQSYNVLCHHCRFNENGISQLFPVHNSVYIVIISDPVETFESMYETYDLGSHYGMNLSEFSNMPTWWFNACQRRSGRFGINQIAFDFGIEEKDFAEYSKVTSYIDELEQVFDLVLIAERFEESVVLLKHFLELTFEEVVYVTLNDKFYNKNSNGSKNMMEKLRKINHVDLQIYEHFARIFHQRVQRFGVQKMSLEIAELRKYNDQWTNLCDNQNVNNGENLPTNAFGEYQAHSQERCKYLAQAEIELTKELRKNHVKMNLSLWTRFLYFIGFYKY